MRLLSRPRFYSFAAIAGCLLCGCLGDAEHVNPLDPLASTFVDAGRIEGRIVDRSLAGIEGADITLSPGGPSVQTASDGTFVLANVPSGTYVVTASSAVHEPSVDTVEVSVVMPGRVDLELNGLPQLVSWSVNTAHISRWWPLNDLFQIEVVATATDGDGVFDLSKVWLEIPSFGFSDTLSATQTTGRFARTLQDSDLPTQTLHALLGTPISLHARDQLLAEVASPAIQLIRVIDETPEATDAAFESGSPNCLPSQSGAGAAPLVEWKEVFLPFPFTHQIDVVRVDSGLETMVEQRSDIPADSTSASVSAVPAGDYYWTVAVIDDFNNRSRSKQVGFCVSE